MVTTNLPMRHFSKEAQQKIQEFVEWSPISSTEKKQVQQLLNDAQSVEQVKAVEDRFLKRLQFGTAGLRGQMGCGYNCMNDLIVIQTSQGLATYFLNKHGQKICAERGIVIGYDGRHSSMRYAHAVAAVFLSKGFRVYLNDTVIATPFIPFAILYKNCLGGVQITASHNPKNDNGYKVYAENGAQIVPPMDSEVSNLILNNLKPWDEATMLLDISTGLLDPTRFLNTMTSLLSDPYHQITTAYYNTMKQELTTNELINCVKKTNVNFVYTPMHGVGYPFVSNLLLNHIGLPSINLHIVEEQKIPDPEFSTVKFPNPEEKGALDLSMELANKKNASIIIANDPDADRLACAEKRPDGTWKIFSGDELGLLLASYMFDFQRKNNKVPANKLVFLCSAVSSRMLQRFAEVENCQFAETNTGFKWIMNKAISLTTPPNNNTFCFAYEEALGYAVTKSVPDKDGISASVILVEMACQLYEKKFTLDQHLQSLYKKYGYSTTYNSYFLYKDPQVVRNIFTKFRNNSNTDFGNYNRKIGKYNAKRIRDVLMCYDDGEKNNECQLPMTPGSEMITLYFDNGVVLTFRTSGTELKLKWYSELISSNIKEAEIILKDTVDAAIESIIEYSKNKAVLQKA